MRTLYFFMVGLISCPLFAAAPGAAPVPAGEDKPLRVAVVAQDAPGYYSAQLLGDMDRPVGNGIKMMGITIPARLDAKGQLELDVRGDGKFRSIARQDVLSLSLKGEGEKPKTQAVKIEVRKKEDGSWVYRNVTHLLVRIESEQLVIVDANGNGTYNEPGVDGITWQGETFLFPLPATTERWCSATQNFTALQLGVWGENAAVNGRPLATTVPTALPVLKGVNSERVKIGLTPRPEDVKLSAELQKHCAYMTGTGQLAHAEDKSKPGYSEEGHNAGMRSILSMGTPAGNVALGMVNTYFHRQDVIRPNTVAFGVGYDGKFGGIDGRTNCSPVQPQHFPVLCPVPGQSGVALSYGKEAPDATPGDPSAGYPITVYFNTRQLKLTSHSLKALGPAGAAAGLKPGSGVNVDCYVFDPQTGASADMTGYQQCVCLIAKDPLQGGTEYEVTMNVEVDGKPWTKTWRFSTAGGGSKPKKR